jgi:ABC-type Mn2+/Zn2+ transport system permease subunit
MALPILERIVEVLGRALSVQVSLPPGPAAVAAAWLSFTIAVALDQARRLRPAR